MEKSITIGDHPTEKLKINLQFLLSFCCMYSSKNSIQRECFWTLIEFHIHENKSNHVNHSNRQYIFNR